MIYAIVYGSVPILRELLASSDLKEDPSIIESRICEANPEFGLSKGINTLSLAMFCCDSEVVKMLLDAGANPYSTDALGNDAFQLACSSASFDNIKYWLKRMPDWDIERRNNLNGSFAAAYAIYMGPNRFELVRFLLDRGTPMNKCSMAGGTLLSIACSSEDADPAVVELLLHRLKQSKHSYIINHRLGGGNLKWRAIYTLSLTIHRLNLSGGSRLISSLAKDVGCM